MCMNSPILGVQFAVVALNARRESFLLRGRTLTYRRGMARYAQQSVVRDAHGIIGYY
jgi:hypothetical protein